MVAALAMTYPRALPPFERPAVPTGETKKNHAGRKPRGVLAGHTSGSPLEVNIVEPPVACPPGMGPQAAGFNSTLIDSNELATLMAVSQSCSRYALVTMPFEVTRPRSSRSIAIG